MRSLTKLALPPLLLASSVVFAAPTKKAQLSVSPAAYATSVADVSCTNVAQRRASLKSALPIIRRMTSNARTPLQKDEFETTAAFQERQAAHYRQLLGGTDKIVLAHKLDPVFDVVKYDADKGVVEIGLYEEDNYHRRSRTGEADYSIDLFRETLSTDTYVASNAYGATREVESSSKVRAALLFPANQLTAGMPRKYDYIKLAMSPEEARRFKADPIALIVATLRPPYVFYDYERIAPTIDYPYETRRGSYGVKVNLQCIVFLSGDREVYRLNFSDS